MNRTCLKAVLCSFLAAIGSQFSVRDIQVSAAGDPPAQQTANPALPPVPDEETAPPLLHLDVSIHGKDELRVYPDQLVWSHGAGLFPIVAHLNNRVWLPKAQPVLQSLADEPVVPDSIDFQTVEVRAEQAPGTVTWGVRGDHLAVQFENKKPGATPRFMVTLRSGSAIPEFTPAPAALKKVSDGLAKHPKRALPASQQTADGGQASTLLDWRRQRLALAFDSHGPGNVPWKSAARDFLERVARAAEPREALVAAGQSVMSAGCDDPLVCCEHGRLLLENGKVADAEPFLLRSVLAFERSGYPRQCSRSAPALLAQVYALGEDDSKRPQLGGLLQRAIEETAQAAGEPFAAGHQRFWLAELREELGSEPQNLLAGCSRRLASVLVKSPHADPWIMHMVAGEALAGRGLPPLQLDDISAPRAEGMGALTHRLQLARAHWIEAWHLHPEFPEAASRLITLTWETGGSADESPRFWFDEAVAAQFDFADAYERFLETLRPARGGEYEQMIAFGVECAATRRFDTNVPQIMLRAARLIARETGRMNDILTKDQGEQALMDVFRGYEERAINDKALLNRVQTEHLLLCWQMDLTSEFRRRIQIVGDTPDAEVLKSAAVSLKTLKNDAKSPAFDAPEIRPLADRVAFAGVRALALLPDNRTLVTNSGIDAPLAIWDLVDGTERPLAQPNGDLCSVLMVSPDGKSLAALQTNTVHVPRSPLESPGKPPPRASGAILIWSLPDYELRELWPVDEYSIYSMSWHSDSRLIVAGMYGGTAVVCDVETGRHRALTDSRGANATGVAVSPDGTQLVVGYYDNTIRWYKLPAAEDLLKAEAAFKLEKLEEAKVPDSSIVHPQFSPDGKFLVTGSRLGAARVWNAATRQILWQLEGIDATISPDGKHVITTHGQGIKRSNIFWSLESGKALARLVVGGARVGQIAAFSSDGDFVITAGMESHIYVWHVGPYK